MIFIFLFLILKFLSLFFFFLISVLGYLTTLTLAVNVACPITFDFQCLGLALINHGRSTFYCNLCSAEVCDEYTDIPTCHSCILSHQWLSEPLRVTHSSGLFFVPRFGFDYGLVHYVVMSTEHDFYQGSEQYYWIAHHLANVDRSTTPWLVFTGHRQELEY